MTLGLQSGDLQGGLGSAQGWICSWASSEHQVPLKIVLPESPDRCPSPWSAACCIQRLSRLCPLCSEPFSPAAAAGVRQEEQHARFSLAACFKEAL